MDLQQNIWFILPEIVIILTVVTVILAELILPEKKKYQTGFLAATGLIIAFLFSLQLFHEKIAVEFFQGMVAHDSWATFFKLLFEITGVLVISMSLASLETRGRHQGEYYALLLSVILGLMFMASATDLIMILLAMETVGILSYVLVGYSKKDSRSSEASVKYLIYGATASGLMLYGMTYLYGLTGSTNLYVIAEALQRGGSGFSLTIVTLLILVGFGFKIAMVPFHMWCPDVYEGAPTPVTGFLSVGPKAAGFALLIRFLFTLFTRTTPYGDVVLLGNIKWPLLLAIVAAFTMTIGNLSALTQNNVKRLLAFSSIAHAGYLLMGVVVVNMVGLRAILFYLVVYMFMNIGAFLSVAAIRDAIGSENIEDYRGIGRRMPFIPVAFAIFLFSLTGLPPFAGFIGKFYLFFAVIEDGLYWLATVAIINTVISLYYYARIVKAMFLDPSTNTDPLPVTGLQIFTAAIAVIPTIVLGIYWAPLIQFAEKSVNLLQ